MDFLNQGIEPQTPPPFQQDGISDFLFGDTSQEPQKEQSNRRAIRWIVMAGNDLPPDFTRQVVEMRMGGENLTDSCRTLLRATNGFLRRCQITPMTIGYDFVNSFSVGVVNPSDTLEDKAVKKRITFDPKTFKTSTDYYYECLPGDELQGLLESQQGAGGIHDKGIREVTALYDENASEIDSTEYKRALAKGIEYQYKIFPEWKAYLNGAEFFPTTEGLTAYLQNRRDELINDSTAVSIIDVILESNAQFERYATASLSRMKDTIEAGKVEGKIYNFHPKHVMWFGMLKLNREAFLTKISETPTVATNVVSKDEFREQGAKLDRLADTVERFVGGVEKLAGINNQSAPEPKGSESETLYCSGNKTNGEPCKAKAQKDRFIDGKAYCANHPKAEITE